MTNRPQPLFRIEPALAGRRRECAAFASSPATHAFLIYSICLLVVAGSVFASQQQLARKATIPGRVELTDGELKLYVDSRRTVSSIRVREGDRVKQGQTLALLRRPNHGSAGDPSHPASPAGYDALLASLEQEAARLGESKSAAQRETRASKASLTARRATLLATLDNQDDEHRALTRLRALGREQLERGRELHKQGHLSLAQLEELDRRDTENALKLSVSIRETLSLRDRMQSLEHQFEMLDLQLEETLSAIDEASGRNARELTQLKMNVEMALVAPVDGVITGLLSHSGATVEASRPFITMVKNKATFRARLWATSKAAGELRNGQSVNLMLDAFPHAKHGMLPGKITHINESPLTLRELDAPWEGTGPTYSITVGLDNSSTLYPQLKPGMNLTADIKLDESRLLERLFEPLIRAWQRTF